MAYMYPAHEMISSSLRIPWEKQFGNQGDLVLSVDVSTWQRNRLCSLSLASNREIANDHQKPASVMLAGSLISRRGKSSAAARQ
jgi:hypothetical protein